MDIHAGIIAAVVLGVLVEKFGLAPITTPEADLESIMGGSVYANDLAASL